MEPRRLLAAAATDAAESPSAERLDSASVESTVGVQYFAEVVDADAEPVTQFEVDVPYMLKVSVQDVRADEFHDNMGGVFSVAIDLSFDDHVVPLDEPQLIRPFSRLPSFPLRPEADLALNAFWSVLQPSGRIEQRLLELPFLVQSSQDVEFRITPAQSNPEHSLVFGDNSPVPRESVVPALVSLSPSLSHPIVETVVDDTVTVPSAVDSAPPIVFFPPIEVERTTAARLISFQSPIESLEPISLQDDELREIPSSELLPAQSQALLPQSFRYEIEDENEWLDSLFFDHLDRSSIEEENHSGMIDLNPVPPAPFPILGNQEFGPEDVDEDNDSEDAGTDAEEKDDRQEMLDAPGWKDLLDRQVGAIEPTLSRRKMRLRLYSPDPVIDHTNSDPTDHAMIDLADLIHPNADSSAHHDEATRRAYANRQRLQMDSSGNEIRGNRTAAVTIDDSSPKSDAVKTYAPDLIE